MEMRIYKLTIKLSEGARESFKITQSHEEGDLLPRQSSMKIF